MLFTLPTLLLHLYRLTHPHTCVAILRFGNSTAVAVFKRTS
jgi:hypothetical protein